jgi:hypothetical protein
MSVVWFQATMSGPEGWARLALGNLTGATCWCDRCRERTDHNGEHHRRFLEGVS